MNEPRIRPLDDEPAPPVAGAQEPHRWTLLLLALLSVSVAAYLIAVPGQSPEIEWQPLNGQQRAMLPQMLELPSGTLTVDGRGGEAPVEFAVRGFSISRTEVTVEQFRLFVQRSGYYNRAWAAAPCLGTAVNLSWDKPGYLQDNTYPVVCVSAVDAMAFTEWLSAETGRSMRLPTEIEWEYAARAGTTTRYWWGDVFDSHEADCNGCAPTSRAHPSYVASWPSNPWGLREVAGNVREWTCSRFLAPLRAESDQCLLTLDETVNLSVRGGSWQEPVEALATNSRRPFSAVQRNVWTGFRIVEVQAQPAR